MSVTLLFCLFCYINKYLTGRKSTSRLPPMFVLLQPIDFYSTLVSIYFPVLFIIESSTFRSRRCNPAFTPQFLVHARAGITRHPRRPRFCPPEGCPSPFTLRNFTRNGSPWAIWYRKRRLIISNRLHIVPTEIQPAIINTCATTIQFFSEFCNFPTLEDLIVYARAIWLSAIWIWWSQQSQLQPPHVRGWLFICRLVSGTWPPGYYFVVSAKLPLNRVR